MSYTIPFTAIVGATITSASHNTGYKDNIIALWVYTTRGDIAYASDASNLTRLPIGAAYQVMRTSVTTVPEWSNLLTGADVRRSTNQTIPSGASTLISFDTETYDEDNYWVVGSPTRLTVPTTGRFLVVAYGTYNGLTSAGTVDLRIMLNGTDVAKQAFYTVSAKPWSATPSVILNASAGNYFELATTQDSGSDATFIGDGNRPKLQIMRVR